MDYWYPCRTAEGDPQLLCELCHSEWVMDMMDVDEIIDIRPEQRQRHERSNN